MLIYQAGEQRNADEQNPFLGMRSVPLFVPSTNTHRGLECEVSCWVMVLSEFVHHPLIVFTECILAPGTLIDALKV